MPDLSRGHVLGEPAAEPEPESEPEPVNEQPTVIYPAFTALLHSDGNVSLVDPNQVALFPMHQASTDQIAAICDALMRRINAGTYADAVVQRQQLMVKQAMESQSAAQQLAGLGDLHRMPR